MIFLQNFTKIIELIFDQSLPTAYREKRGGSSIILRRSSRMMSNCEADAKTDPRKCMGRNVFIYKHTYEPETKQQSNIKVKVKQIRFWRS